VPDRDGVPVQDVQAFVQAFGVLLDGHHVVAVETVGRELGVRADGVT
jgi:hypothetical protein